ncbi:DoxX family protein [Streptomyces sp. NPDC016845]|uniref:DoxX family protein n=1 Tax=Streptomyces sp. NPDC016845 TaxID=3364972 RepID=UPI00378C0DE0
MSANYVSLTVVLSLVLVGSAVAKVRRQESLVATMRRIGVPDAWLPRLAALEIAGAVGLLVGLAFRPLAVAAGVGVVLYFAGAVVFHVRAHDRKGLIAPGALTVVALLVSLLALQNT